MGVPAFRPAIRVLVIDDSVAFRDAVHELIDAAAEFMWSGEACCGEDGVEEARRLRPDLVLVDVRMPGIGGIKAAARITSEVLPTPVVILVTAADLPTDVPEATAAGMVAKDRLIRTGLKPIWEDHKTRARSRDAARAWNPGPRP